MKKKKIIIGLILLTLLIACILFFLISGRKYTVTFNSNGGTAVESIKVKKNHMIEEPKNPTKKGYQFAGWYFNNKLFDFKTKITKNITLKAHWQSNGIELESDHLNLVVGLEDEIKILSLPDGITIEDLVFTSSDESIATVSQDGKIKALKNGTVTITVKSKDNQYRAKCKITITEKKIEIKDISIDGASSLVVGSSIQLTVKISPDDATREKMMWKSSDPSIATVDENGNVKGVKAGKVTITVTTENGKTATKTITIKAKQTSSNNNNNGGQPNPPSVPKEILPTNVSISGGSNTMYVGDRGRLTANITPGDANDKGVSWSSNNASVVSVDGSGNIVANGVGQATITVRTNAGGKTATITITVIERPASYSIILTPIKQEGTGSIAEYTFVVMKNGNTFNEYIGFEYGGGEIHNGGGTVLAKFVGGGSATLILNDYSRVSVSVIINN